MNAVAPNAFAEIVLWDYDEKEIAYRKSKNIVNTKE